MLQWLELFELILRKEVFNFHLFNRMKNWKKIEKKCNFALSIPNSTKSFIFIL